MAGLIHKKIGTYGEPQARGDISDAYFGKYCSIAQNVILDLGWHHNTDFVTTFPLNLVFDRPDIKSHPKTKGDIIIHNDVWIGEGAIIMSGVEIGNGAIIGSRSIVTKNVLPYSIVGGVPAKEIKKRFSDNTIERLQKLKWWDWHIEKIKENIELLMNNNINLILEKHNL